MADEPDSARRLQAALEAFSDAPLPKRSKRPARDTKALYELAFQSPAPEVPWVPVSTFGDLDYALDEARDPVRSHPEGTLYRIMQGGHVAWLGVMAYDGRVVDAPRALLNAPNKAPDWVTAWEGPDAKGDWMLRQAGGVDRRLFVWAALDCVRGVVESSTMTEVRRQLGLVEAWLRSPDQTPPPAPVGRVWSPYDATTETDTATWGRDRDTRSLNRGTANLTAELIEIANAPSADEAGALARSLLNTALFVLTSREARGSAAHRALQEKVRRGFGREVRKTIPLGLVLLARLPRRPRRATARA
jgi:hypothetical protein